MSAPTTLLMANGRWVDLAEPKFEASDFHAIAEHLAKEKRFNGATAGVEYSVAEHCVRGCDAIRAQVPASCLAPDALAALDQFGAYFLLHDAHEALIKDVTTPAKALIGHVAREQFGVLGDAVLDAFKAVEHQLDAALHEAAGLAWPPSDEIAAAVKAWDKILFVTEWRDLMGDGQHPAWTPYADSRPLDTTIVGGWRWPTARDAWIGRAKRLFPALQKKAHAA